MPFYIFKLPKKEIYIEIAMGMDDPHEVFLEDGTILERVWSIPQGVVKDTINPVNPHSFVDYTKKRKGSYGDIIDLAVEASEKRAKNSNNGRDPMKDKFFDSYSKKRHGKRHPEDDR